MEGDAARQTRELESDDRVRQQGWWVGEPLLWISFDFSCSLEALVMAPKLIPRHRSLSVSQSIGHLVCCCFVSASATPPQAMCISAAYYASQAAKLTPDKEYLADEVSANVNAVYVYPSARPRSCRMFAPVYTRVCMAVIVPCGVAGSQDVQGRARVAEEATPLAAQRRHAREERGQRFPKETQIDVHKRRQHDHTGALVALVGE